ncbi:MAG: polymerase, beta domain protein region protein [Parcubacteria group bacterium GW2011_GWA2_43_9b]|uniref:Polymerase beta nucleotidyltransferase domain-containing protein n=1 Tax=Candidatus Portnoybacteria bacterium RIFCSPLOWO2_02_FULL_39_11 TaxID=1802001 RepID=A0A1G2FVC0_9BACT|nr:MAG: polymerase, beta domain protein region protein [Parcubacteria group bacterium GW2011_GWA2_43_9b]OGZ42019.1 MAG: hypothetical protein A3B04_03005 [Candidatus Portnoybacteria bacterium RIFCSPLOWO2_02_FULL_39_11]
MNAETEKKLNEVFASYPEIKLVYFFGSHAIGQEGPMSDYDLAFYSDEKDRKTFFDLKLELINEISRILHTDDLDVIALNSATSPELKYNIIKDGRLIYEKEPFRILIEPRILSEYFDFRDLLLRHNLTRAI